MRWRARWQRFNLTFSDPWRIDLRRAVVIRILSVVAASAVIGLGHEWSRWVLVPFAVVVGVAVFCVWRKTRQWHKEPWAYALYTVSMLAGLVLLTADEAARELGVSPPIAVFGGLGAVLAGYAGLLSVARGSRLVRQRAAIAVEAAAIAAAGIACWTGLLVLERSDGTNPSWRALLAGGGVLLYVALSLLSESVLVHREEAVPPRRPGGPDERRFARVEPARLWVPTRQAQVALAVAGVVVLATVAWLVLAVEMSAAVVVFVVVALGLLLLAIAADGIADVAAVLVVVSLAWSLAPRTVAFEAEPLAAGDVVLVALGDSYISGEGATRFFEGTNDRGRNECRRAPSAYAPELVRRDTTPDLTRLVFVACSGARAAHLDARVQHPDEPLGGPPRLRGNGVWETGATQLEQLDEVLRAVRANPADPGDDPVDAPVARPDDVSDELHGLVVVSIGGNDAGFGTIATACAGLGNCADVVDAWTADLAVVGARLDRAYAALRRVVGDEVPVLVVPYPVPLAERRCDVSAMTQAEHTALRRFVERLDAEVTRAATDAGFHVLDLQPAFDGHRICDTDSADDWYLNYIAAHPTGGSFTNLSNPRNWFHNSFHPNARGHRAIADEIQRWMADHRDEITRSRFRVAEEPFRLAGVADAAAVADRPSEQLGTIGVEPCQVSGDRWEERWTACSMGHSLRRFVVPAFVFVVALWVVAFAALHAYRVVTDPRPSAGGHVGVHHPRDAEAVAADPEPR